MEELYDAREATMGDLIREFQRDLQSMNHRLGALKERQRRIHNTPPPINLRHDREEEDYSLRLLSNDEEPQPNRFRVTYKRRIMPPQQHDFGMRIDLPRI